MVLPEVKLIPEVLSGLQEVESLSGHGLHHLVGSVVLDVQPPSYAVGQDEEVLFVLGQPVNLRGLVASYRRSRS